MSEKVSEIPTPAIPDIPQTLIHPSFEKKRSESIESLNITIEEYQHKTTGALHYHLASEQDENVFLVAFRTMPMDSTGVAHILEHTALCGSDKYPVRDPFFMMIRRSLNTFMNAMTSSDWTAYPFASKNKKDFNNLLNVYLDATFFARLHHLDFLQEGHRLEFEEASNSDSNLQYKGVVFNEMKGAMSSATSVLWQSITTHLFPTTTYHFNSGGEPSDIPKLTYEQLKSFYRKHYHPSNAVFMTFGNISAYEHQTEFEDNALSRFKSRSISLEQKDELRYLKPKRVTEFYAADKDEEKQTHIVIGWLLGSSTNLTELFQAELLSIILLDNSSSPMLEALETSELGSAPSPICGLENSNREMTFILGFEGCDSNDLESVEGFILQSLSKIAKLGIDQKTIEAAIHQLELSQREITGDSYPYGLQLILSALSGAIHHGDPINLLNVDQALTQLQQDIQDPLFIANLIKNLFIKNPHRVTLSLQPDTELAGRKEAEEKNKLATIKASLSQEEKEEIIEAAARLLERQNHEDDASILPKVGLDDIPKTISEPRVMSLDAKDKKIKMSYYPSPTNGIAYQHIVYSLPHLSEEQKSLLPLFTSCITELGINDLSYKATQELQAQISGGINCHASIRAKYNDIQEIASALTFSSKYLNANHASVSKLLHSTIQNVRFEETQRIKDLIDQILLRKENSITGQGHSLAMSVAASKISPTAAFHHDSSGMEGIRRLRHLRDDLIRTNDYSKILETFNAIHQSILLNDKQILLIAEPHFENELANPLKDLWNDETATRASSFSLGLTREHVSQAWVTNSPVNYCAKAFCSVGADHADYPVLQVLAGYIRNGFLHKSLREQGGAYGGGATQDPSSASFRFYSYRDPRLEETLTDFDMSIKWMLNGTHSNSSLEEAIIGVIAAMDKPGSPAGEATQAFYNMLFGRKLEHRILFRERVLATTLNDLKRVTEQYLYQTTHSTGVIGSWESVRHMSKSGFEVEKM
tara:strand:+ start:1766 stop:4732 length:2967 start_codon:yes stop_codon:yes gene_type:complete